MERTLDLIVLFLLGVAANCSPTPKTRIIGGSYADRVYPYMVSIRDNGTHICGGSIIANEWITTAAHCIHFAPTKVLSVVVGSSSLLSGGTEYPVVGTRIHHQYDGYNRFDVGLLKVSYITYSETVQPINIDTIYLGADIPTITTGWGFFASNVSQISNDLRQIALKTMENQACSHEMFHTISRNEICVKTDFGEGMCHADSGGPLVRDVDGTLVQIGISSWMIGCADGKPDVYQRTSYFLEWFRTQCGFCF